MFLLIMPEVTDFISLPKILEASHRLIAASKNPNTSNTLVAKKNNSMDFTILHMNLLLKFIK